MSSGRANKQWRRSSIFNEVMYKHVYLDILMRVDGTIFIRDKKILIIKIKSTFCIVLYQLIMTIIAPQWFLGQLMSMFIFLLILILGFLKFLRSNCPKQCQLYCPNIARSENQFWNANKPSLCCSPVCFMNVKFLLGISLDSWQPATDWH